MKINSTTNRPLSADAVGTRPESAVAQAYGASSASGSSSSQVALSSASRKMLARCRTASNDINVERVAAIRAWRSPRASSRSTPAVSPTA